MSVDTTRKPGKLSIGSSRSQSLSAPPVVPAPPAGQASSASGQPKAGASGKGSWAAARKPSLPPATPAPALGLTANINGAANSTAGVAQRGPAPLSEEEKEMLKKHKDGNLHTLAQKTATMGDPQPEYQEAAQQKQPWYKRLFTRENAENAGEATAGAGGVATDIASVIGGFVGSMEEGNNIAGAVMSCVDVLKDIYGLGKQIITSIKEKDGSSGNIAEIAKQSLTTLMDMGKAASDISKLFSAFSHIPIIGAVFGAVSTAISLISNVKDLVNGSIDYHRMSKQRQAAARKIGDRQKNPQGATAAQGATANVDDTGALSMFQLQKHSVMRDDMRANGTIADVKTGKTRKKRLDDVLADTNVEMSSGLRHDAENLAISQELALTNKHRISNSVYDIVMGDFVDLGKTIVALIPAIGGEATAAGISLAQTGVSLGRRGIRALRQYGRDHGWKGFSSNKSTYNKKVRRHRLAVMLYKHIKNLSTYGIDQADANGGTGHTEEQLKNFRTALTEYPIVGHQISALQVGYYHLHRAENADAMVALMREGFYASGSED